MDIEKFKKDQRELVTQFADTQAERYIGEAVLRLVSQGRSLNVETICQDMHQSVAHLKEEDLWRIPVVTAIAGLLDAAKPK